MSKSLRSIPESKRDEVIARRIDANTGGLGFLAAKDAKNAKIRKEIVKNLPK